MITKKFKVVKKNKGVKNLNMRARVGWGKHIYFKSKEKACLLCRAKRGRGWEAAAHSASVEGQSRKFFFLKGKIKKGKGAPKNEGKNFLLCSPQGERRRWVGLPPCGRQSKVSVRIFFEKGSDFIQ